MATGTLGIAFRDAHDLGGSIVFQGDAGLDEAACRPPRQHQSFADADGVRGVAEYPCREFHHGFFRGFDLVVNVQFPTRPVVREKSER